MKKAVLMSGGLDSTVILWNVVKEFGAENVVAIYTYFGQRNTEGEKQSFKRQCEKLGVKNTRSLDLSKIFADVSMEEETEEGKSTPKGTRKFYNRNLVLISSAAAVAMQNECDTIYHGAHYSDSRGGFVDCTKKFYKAAKKAISVAYPWFTVEMPLIKKTKEQVVQWGIDAGMTENDFASTWSCYHAPTEETYEVNGEKFLKPCGICETCIDRHNGLKNIFPNIL